MASTKNMEDQETANAQRDWKRLPRTVWSAVRSHVLPRMQPSVSFLIGIACGISLVAASQSWLDRFGFSLVPRIALVLAAVIGIGLAYGERTPQKIGARLAVLLTIPGWVLFSVVLYGFGAELLSVVPLRNQAQFLFGLMTLLPIAVMTVGVTCGIVTCGIASESKSSTDLASTAFGIAAGTFLHILITGPLMGSGWSLLIAAAAIGGAFWRRSLLDNTEPVPSKGTVPSGSSSSRLERCGVVLLAGLSIPIGQRLLQQLMPETAGNLYTLVAMLTIGLGLGFRFGSKSRERSAHAACLIGLSSIAMLLLFPSLINLNLSLNASTGSVVWLSFFRAMQFALLIPVGVAIGQMLNAETLSDSDPIWSTRCLLGSLFCGWLITAACLSNGVPLAWLLPVPMAGAVLFLATSAWRVARGTSHSSADETQPAPTSAHRRMSLGWRSVMVGTLLVCCFATGMYSPMRASRLLFSTTVLVAWNTNLDEDSLDVLDEGRLIETREGDRGTFTFWRHRGSQIQVRQSGMPKAVASTDPMLCPHFPGELLPLIMTFSLHPRPDRVLMLGASSGTGVSKALRYPVQELICCETETALLEGVETHLWSHEPDAVADDPRVTILNVSPQWAVKAGDDTFDVIVSMPDHPAIADASGCYSSEFYAHASRRLAEKGLFCQRFAFQDLGAEPLLAVLETARREFRELVVVEVSSGEVVLLGANSTGVVVPDQFDEALQLPQTRELLAEMGWDWAEVLNLVAVSSNDLSVLLGRDRPQVNTCLSNHFAWQFPFAVMRWSPKIEEARMELATVGERYLEWIIDEKNENELVRRVKEINKQRRLMVEHPDQPWSYRKVVKEQLKKNPRTLLHQESGQLARHKIHPEDRARLDYFQALSDAMEKPTLTEDDIDSIMKNVTPFDPLLTEFAHQEVSKLIPRMAPKNSELQLRHQLHAVYFAEPGSQSVRDVLGAMQLIIDEPEVLQTDFDRQAHLESLMQRLLDRWKARGLQKPVGSIDILLGDVTRSISLCHRTLKWIDKVESRSEPEEERWQRRRQHMKVSIVHPLEMYQTVLHQHREKREKRLEEIRRDPESFGKQPKLPLAN